MMWAFEACISPSVLFFSLAFPEYPVSFQLTEKTCIPSHFEATKALIYRESADENDC